MENNTGNIENLCACGCGKPTIKNRRGVFNKFFVGHNTKHGKATHTSKNGTHSGQFQAGNTYGQGRPVGSKNSVTVAAENIIQGEGEALSRKLIEMALDGNPTCLKIAIERIVPVCKSRQITLPSMPKIDSVADASKLTAYVLVAIADGTVSPVKQFFIR